MGLGKKKDKLAEAMAAGIAASKKLTAEAGQIKLSFDELNKVLPPEQKPPDNVVTSANPDGTTSFDTIMKQQLQQTATSFNFHQPKIMPPKWTGSSSDYVIYDEVTQEQYEQLTHAQCCPRCLTGYTGKTHPRRDCDGNLIEALSTRLLAQATEMDTIRQDMAHLRRYLIEQGMVPPPSVAPEE